ncbi:MAG: class I SAM-dependent methyltransferase [Myxococcaceae bacterium]|nr:class I SAM-dependent methyltransferase [Myxococcaceae bacterium]
MPTEQSALSRAPFLASCPVCGATEASEVITFPELRFGRCAGCGLIYKQEQRPGLGEGYEEKYFRFNRAGYLQRWDHRVRKCRRQLLASLEFAPHARSLLDVGCSAGYVLAAAKSLGLAEMGLDLSEFAVQLCRERGFQAERGSLTQMPFADASFDIVTAKHTLEHVESPMDGLREIHRVLRPGGVAFLVVPDAAYYKIPLMPRRGRSFRPDRRGWQHHVYFYEHNLADACTRVGLTPLKAGKDIFRRRLARGPRAAWEYARYAFLLGWVHGSRVTRMRRELQLISVKPVAAQALPPPQAEPRAAVS